MDKLNKVLKSMDFEYFATGKHKQDVASFLCEKDAVFLDLRNKEEVETLAITLKHHMPVFNIAVTDLPDRLNELPKDKKIGLFCSSGVRIAIAYTYLKAADYENVVMLPGGLEAIVPELKPGKILKAIRR